MPNHCPISYLSPARLLACILGAVVVLFSFSAASQPNKLPKNLLSEKKILGQRGVGNTNLLTDGEWQPEGTAPSEEVATTLGVQGSFVIWDLGKEVGIRASLIQADNNDAYRLSISNDGLEFTPLWIVPLAAEPGLRVRLDSNLKARGRYIQLECLQGDDIRAVSELQLFRRVPKHLPPSLDPSQKARDKFAAGVREERVYAWHFVAGIGALLALFYLLPKLKKKWERILTYSILVVLGVASWYKYGHLHGETAIQFWDGYHYFLSSKYFPEVGYHDLYRCVAKAEREMGRGAELDRSPIRNLDDNSLHPGTWSKTKEGRCRGEFSQKRWEAFKGDVTTYRGLFPKDLPLPRSFTDHGFNATPVHAAWLHLINKEIMVSREKLLWLAQLDTLAIALVCVFLWWGFGPQVGITALFVIVLGYNWGYRWVGGSVARFTWLFFASAGVSLLKKDRPLLGSVALTVSGLLRLFPFAFVGAVGVYVLARIWKTKRLDNEGRRILLGILATCLAGFLFAGSVVGFRSFSVFAEVATLHSETSLANHMGFSMITGARQGDLNRTLTNPSLPDPNGTWRHKLNYNRESRKPILWFFLALSFAFIGLAAWKGYPSWKMVGTAGPLIFGIAAMTSYDYVYLILMLPLGLTATHRQKWILYFTLFVILFGMFTIDIELQHIVDSIGFLVLSLAIMRDVALERREMSRWSG